MLFPENIGRYLSIDEVALTNGELYTIVTNKIAYGRKGALVAMVAGTKAEVVSAILSKLSLAKRMQVIEVTLDMANSMDAIIKASFPNARLTTDRFHVQQLISDAVQRVRIDLRWKAIEVESQAIRRARDNKLRYIPYRHANGDTNKQLLARSRLILFKPKSKWSPKQAERAKILFEAYPQLEAAYDLSMAFRACYEHSSTRDEAKTKLNAWYKTVEDKDNIKSINSFITAKESIKAHEHTILNYFINNSTNASAESFNAKLKNFRAVVRGVRDKKFHLFRVAMLYG